MPTKEELLALGWNERFIVDRNTHPSYHISSWPTTGMGQQLLAQKAHYRLPHINPQSVLVVVASNAWCPAGWYRLQDMLRHTEQAGYMVALEEVNDISLMPMDAIGVMRSCAAMMALDAGVEWCFMVDTDTLLEPDTLVRLLQWDQPVVFPLLNDLENKYPGTKLVSPTLQPNTGLHPVVWGAMSVMLFNVKVFNCLNPYAWHGSDYHFAQHLGHFGHRIYVDTDTLVNVSRGPARHLAKSWDELWASLRVSFEHLRNDDRDRKPPPWFDPVFGDGQVDRHGTYWALDSDRRVSMNGPETRVGQDNHANHN